MISISENKIKEMIFENIHLFRKYGVKKTVCFAIMLFILEGDASMEFDLATTFTTEKNDNYISQEKVVTTTNSSVIANPNMIKNVDPVEEILNKYNLTQEEFDIIVAVVHGEATANSYEDAYAVINTIYNRTKSKAWINEVNKVMNLDGTNLYNQVICKGQFSVYIDGIYKKYLGVKDTVTYQAVIDFLTSEEIMHNYLSFKSSGSNPTGKVQFVANGNRYHNELTPEDRVNDLSLTRKKN